MALLKNYVYKYKCAICDELFKDVMNLVVHVRAHAGQKIYKCKFCQKLFIYKGQLAKHLIKHSRDEKKYTCDICLQTFCSYVKFMQHIKRHGKPYFCNTCKQGYHSSLLLRQHLCSKSNDLKLQYDRQAGLNSVPGHNPELRAGDDEQTETISYAEIRNNILDNISDSADTPYQCFACRSRFDCNRSLVEHLHRCHGSELVVVNLALPNDVNGTDVKDFQFDNFIDSVSSVAEGNISKNSEVVNNPNQLTDNNAEIDHSYSLKKVIKAENRIEELERINDCSEIKTEAIDGVCGDNSICFEEEVQNVDTDCIMESGIKVEPEEHVAEKTPRSITDKVFESMNFSMFNEPVTLSTKRKRIHRCYVCFKTFPDQFKLKKHSVIHSNKNITEKASEIFSSLVDKKRGKDLNTHVKVPSTTHPFLCNICDVSFRNSSFLKNHLELIHEDKALRCGSCSLLFQNQESLLEHEKVHNIKEQDVKDLSEERPFMCEVCLKSFKHKNKLLIHKAIHTKHNNAPLPCKVCSKVFFLQKNLAHHMQIHNSRDTYCSCEECGKSFLNIYRLRRHFLVHTENRPFICNICSKGFKDKDNLVKHKVLHSDVRFPCDICEKVFKTKKILARHRNLHTGSETHISLIETFVCSFCGKKFATPSGLRTHEKKHTEDGEDGNYFMCEICSKAFNAKYRLNEHIQSIHSGMRPFLCDICQKTFTLEKYLKKHKKIHTKQDNPPMPCKLCSKVFYLRKDLLAHKEIHNSKDTFCSCEKCGKTFLNGRRLKRHLLVHTEHRPFVCDICTKAFKDKSHLVKHKAEVHSDNKYCCEVCGKKLKRLGRHVCTPAPSGQDKHSDCSSGKAFTCSSCGKVYAAMSSLIKHEKMHTATAFTCEQCEKQFFSNSKLKRHLAIVHSEIRPFACDVCDKTFKMKTGLRKHKQTHTKYDNPPLPCKICNKIFYLQKNLSNHMEIHNTSSCACDRCGRCFLNVHRLRRHMLVHSENRPFVCEVCGKGFKDKGQMVEHMKIHATVRRTFECEFCSKEFTSGLALKIHIRSHTGERPFMCSFCPLAFRQSVTLKDHERTHTGDKPYCCPDCPKRFGSKSTYNKHKLVHFTLRPFPCDECGFKFKDKDSLKRHINSVHLNLREFACQYCTRDFKRGLELKKHVLKNHNFGNLEVSLEEFDIGDELLMETDN